MNKEPAKNDLGLGEFSPFESFLLNLLQKNNDVS